MGGVYVNVGGVYVNVGGGICKRGGVLLHSAFTINLPNEITAETDNITNVGIAPEVTAIYCIAIIV